MKKLLILSLLSMGMAGCELKAQDTIHGITYWISDGDSIIDYECHYITFKNERGRYDPVVYRGACVTDSLAIDYLLKNYWSQLTDTIDTHNINTLFSNQFTLQKRLKLQQAEIDHLNYMVTILLKRH